MAEQSGEKSEEPTQKKIDDSRKKGQVWKSRDLTGVAVFLVGMGTVKAMWPMVETEIRGLFQLGFDALAHPENLEQATYNAMGAGIRCLLLLTAPVALAAAVVGGLMDFLQVGPLFAGEAIQPKLDKLNPVSGMKNLFSKKQIVEAVKSLAKICIAAYVVYGAVRDSVRLIISTIRADADLTMAVLGELVFKISVRVGILFLIFAIFDVWWQRRSYYKDMMMTKEEVKREYKESEGDPHHKAKRKEMHQEILEGAMMEAVKDDVVVTTQRTWPWR